MAAGSSRRVSVRRGNSLADGSCNGCDTHIDPNTGLESHRVWVIELQQCSFRLCDECWRVLRDVGPFGRA